MKLLEESVELRHQTSVLFEEGRTEPGWIGHRTRHDLTPEIALEVREGLDIDIHKGGDRRYRIPDRSLHERFALSQSIAGLHPHDCKSYFGLRGKVVVEGTDRESCATGNVADARFRVAASREELAGGLQDPSLPRLLLLLAPPRHRWVAPKKDEPIHILWKPFDSSSSLRVGISGREGISTAALPRSSRGKD